MLSAQLISKFFHNKIKEKVIFLHYITTDNIGDLYCCPGQYFKCFKDCKELELLDYENFNPKNKVLIIGGGGLLQKTFEKAISHIVSLRDDNKIIFWGIGLDNSPIHQKISPEILKGSHLIGVRDFNTQYKYVPCVSCMSGLFDKYRKIKPKTKIRCYLHSMYDFPDELSSHLETYINNQGHNDKAAMHKAIDYLSGAEYIITNSFHGVYWATLLNRKVIALPFCKDGDAQYSEKFLTLKYKPVYIDDFKTIEYCLKDKLKAAVNYENALEDARKINIEFFNEVKKML